MAQSKGCIPWNKGLKGVQRHSEETRNKIRTAAIAKCFGKWMIGKTPSLKTRLKLRLKMEERKQKLGYYFPPGTREKAWIVNKGSKRTAEQRKKISDALKGIKQSPESIEKRRLANFGKKRTMEIREKISKARKVKNRDLISKPSKIGQRGRHIFEKFFYRKLLSTEEIHHVDQNRDNNELANLFYFRHCTAHKRLHAFAWRHNLKTELFNFPQPWLYATVKT